MNSLQEKLNIKDVHHFSLVLHNLKSHMPARMMLLQEQESIAEVRQWAISLESRAIRGVDLSCLCSDIFYPIVTQLNIHVYNIDLDTVVTCQ